MTSFKCSSCTWAFFEMTDLVFHCKEDHHSTDTSRAGVEHVEILLECPWCVMVFDHQNKLVHHVTVHHWAICHTLEQQEIIKLFKCPLCKWAYYEASDLINHSKQKHHVSNDTTAANVENISILWVCPSCPLVFDHKYELVQHRMVSHR